MKNIPEQEIRQFYKEYKKAIRLQDAYESILYVLYMKPQQREKWFLLLQEKSAFQKKTFQENEEKIQRIIQPFLKEGEDHVELTQETADIFFEEITQMASQLIFDSLLTIEMLKRLISFYAHLGERDKEISCWFYLGYFYGFMNNPKLRQETLLCYEKVISYQNQYEDITDPKIRRIIILAFFNRSNWDEESKEEFNSLHLQNLMEAFLFCKQEEKKEILNPLLDVNKICRLLEDSICRELLKKGNEEGRNSQTEEMEQAYYGKLEEDSSSRRLFACEFYNHWKYKLITNQLSEKEYYEKLYEYYIEEPWQKFRAGGAYNATNLVQMMPLFQPELFRGAEQFHPERMAGLKEKVRWFYVAFPRSGNKAYVDRLITSDIMQVIPYYNREEAMDLYEKILFIRQSATDIHVRGVGKLVVAIADLMLEQYPEYAVGLLGTADAREVSVRRKEILEFLWQCAMQHDRGKILISTIINMQVRALTELEWQSIKEHTEYGLEGGEQYTGLKKYYNVILGHHKYYNGEGGYPEAFDNVSCEDKFAIDLVTICDCLDAATDKLGRNYTNSKTVTQVLQELDRDKGVKYSPQIVDFIKSHPELIEKLEEITGSGRRETYYEAYHAFAREKEEKVPCRS